ncbi:MAG: HlyD family efflux transporter periplasmic adaptor subunit [Planctomycetia bacterium]|jgi:multidrug efflux pump subunit AcrA (membrane-fusion protein)
MSTEQSLNPELIEQTKQQIRSLVNEIAQLSKSDIAPNEYYPAFLTKTVSALAAIGGVVWTVEDQGRLALQYQINLQKTDLRENEEAQIQHGRLLQKVMTTGEPVLVPPHSGTGDAADTEDQASNPTDFLLLLGPIKTDLEVVGAIEIFQRPETGINTQKGYLRFLTQMCDLAADFIKGHQLRHYSDRQVMWTQLEDFTRMVHASLDPRLTAFTIANEGRRLIECDRVSVAIRRGRKYKVESVSGQDTLEKRSNTVRLLGRLATKVVEAEEPIWYTGDTSNMAPQIEEALHEYIDESHSKTVAVLPLGRPAPPEEEQDPDKPEEPEPPIGALIVERIEDARIPETMRQRMDVVTKHSSLALANSLEHQDLFLMPVWRALGKMKWIVRGRTLPKTIAIAIAIIAIIVMMFVMPWDFELQADGKLEPVNQSDVFASVSGKITEVKAKHDQDVIKGQELAKMRSTEIAMQIRELEGDIESAKKSIQNKQWLLSEHDGNAQERNQLIGEIHALEEKFNSLQSQLKLAKEKDQELVILSPRKGKILTWEPEKTLRNRPVERGQVLMEVADTEGPWQIELTMPEDRMGYIAKAQKEFDTKHLKVTFILASEPGKEYEGTIKEINYNAEIRGQEGNTVLVKVDIEGSVDKERFPGLRPGTEVKAKVYCGRKPVGFVLFHDLWAFIESKILFRF